VVKKSYIDDHIKRKSFVPAPDKYIKQDVWCELSGSQKGRGVFLKDIRNTPADTIFLNEKRRPMPSPDKYQNLDSWKSQRPKIPGNYSQKNSTICFTDDFANMKLHNCVPPIGKY
jgi:hypothetical protein